MHIFPYSIRPGTPAAKMEQVAKSVKEERAARAAAVAEEMRKAYLEGCVGSHKDIYVYDTFNSLFEVEVLEKFTEDMKGKMYQTTVKEVLVYSVFLD